MSGKLHCTVLSLKFQVVRLMAQVGGESNSSRFCLVLLYFSSIFLPKEMGDMFIIGVEDSLALQP